MPNTKVSHWNPIVETLPREQIRELQLKKLQPILKWSFEHPKFHRTLYENASTHSKEIHTFDDIHLVPKVEKALVPDIQRKEAFSYGDALWVPLEEVVGINTSDVIKLAEVPK